MINIPQKKHKKKIGKPHLAQALTTFPCHHGDHPRRTTLDTIGASAYEIELTFAFKSGEMALKKGQSHADIKESRSRGENGVRGMGGMGGGEGERVRACDHVIQVKATPRGHTHVRNVLPLFSSLLSLSLSFPFVIFPFLFSFFMSLHTKTFRENKIMHKP